MLDNDLCWNTHEDKPSTFQSSINDVVELINQGFTVQRLGKKEDVYCSTFPPIDVPFIPLGERWWRNNFHRYDFVYWFCKYVLVSFMSFLL